MNAFAVLCCSVAVANAQQWTQVGQDILGPNPNDYLGRSVAMSGDGTVIAITAQQVGTTPGKVRLHTLQNGVWDKSIEFFATANNALIDFPVAVALSQQGTRFIVGERHVNNDPVRVIDDGGSTQVGGVLEFSLGNSGQSVDISADGLTLVVGSPGFADANDVNVGQVTIHVWSVDTNNWNQIATITGTATDARKLGIRVAISDDGGTIAMSSEGLTQGHVEIWVLDEATQNSETGPWRLLQSISLETPQPNFGKTLALSGDGTIVAIGDLSGGGGNGAVYIYGSVLRVEEQSLISAWDEIAQPITGHNGYSLALSRDGQILAVEDLSEDIGSVKVYKADHVVEGQFGWSQIGNTLTGESTDDRFGESIAMSDDGLTIAIGASHHDNDRGRVKVYSLSASNDDDSDLSTGAVVGIAVGATAGASAIGFALWYFGAFATAGAYREVATAPFL